MAEYLIQDTTLKNIADNIRSFYSTLNISSSETYTPGAMATAINDLQNAATQSCTITFAENIGWENLSIENKYIHYTTPQGNYTKTYLEDIPTYYNNTIVVKKNTLVHFDISDLGISFEITHNTSATILNMQTMVVRDDLTINYSDNAPA